MDIDIIKEIVNSEDSVHQKEIRLLEHLASDKDCIPILMRILNSERTMKRELIKDMNLELSRAHIYIDMMQESKSDAKGSFNKGFVLNEIAKFYFKYKQVVTHCFNRFN